MIDSETAVARCADLVETARRLGADAADAVTSAQASESVSIRLGKLEEVERSEGESISLRVMVGQRSASIQTSDFSRDSFAELAERALAMARLLQETAPHHRKRNNNEPARTAQTGGMFAASAAPTASKVDRRTLCTPKLKRGPRLPNTELVARGLAEYAGRDRNTPPQEPASLPAVLA